MRRLIEREDFMEESLEENAEAKRPPSAGGLRTLGYSISALKGHGVD